MRDMRITFRGNNINTVKTLVKYYSIDISHFDAKRASTENNRGTKKEFEILCVNSKVERSTLKNYILKHNLIPYACSGSNCAITDTWNGNPIVLHLEHKNGIGNDNRIENICFLCPNCHSQTVTYAGRNVLGSKRNKAGEFIHA